MSNHHLRNPEMSLKSKGLLSLILSLPPTWNYSLSGLCAICKESQTAMRSALKELESHKYLIRKRQKNALGQFEYEYIVYEIPHTENVHTDNQHTQKVHTENRLQINKEKINTDKSNKEEINKDNIYIEQFENILLKEVSNEPLRQLYREYIEMRETIKAPMTERGLKMLIQRCERLANMDLELQKALVETAIINSWKNVYLPNEQDIQNNNTLASLKRIYGGQ